MKKKAFAILILTLPLISCGLFRQTISINDVIAQKTKLDKITNPAKKQLMLQDLGEKKIKIGNALVKQVSSSTNIDYDYCVIVDVQSNQGKVECYIYTSNVKQISRLVIGQTRIDVVGEFARFFTLLDESYTKIEIVNSSISIK